MPLTDQKIEEIVEKMVKEHDKNPAVYGYCVKDEPGASQFPVITKLGASIEKRSKLNIRRIVKLPRAICCVFVLLAIFFQTAFGQTKSIIVPIAAPASDVLSGYDNGSYYQTGDQSQLFVGNLNQNPGKSRCLLKFNLANLPASFTSATLNLTGSFLAGPDPQVIKVTAYNVNAGAGAFTATDLADSLDASTYLVSTTVTGSAANSGSQRYQFDVTRTVRAAKAAGWAYVSFMLYNQTANDQGTGTACVFFQGPYDAGSPCLTISSDPSLATPALIGTPANDLLSGYSSGGYWQTGDQSQPFVGNINGNPGNSRCLMKFDVSSFPDNISTALLSLTGGVSYGTDPQVVGLNAYNVNVGASSFTTADLVNSLATSTPISSTTVHASSVNDTLFKFDVTEAVKAAKAAGWTHVSFLLYDQTANAQGAGTACIYFKGAYDAGAPTLSFATVPPPNIPLKIVVPGNDLLSGYSNGSYCLNGEQSSPFVGNLNDLPGNSRCLMKFDISALGGPVTSAKLRLTGGYLAGTNPQVVKLNTYDLNVGARAFTSTDINDALGNSSNVCSITVTETAANSGNRLYDLDVTRAVQAAEAAGWSHVSFLLYDQTANDQGTGTACVFFQGPYDPGSPTLDVTTSPIVPVANGLCRASIHNVATTGPASPVELFASTQLQSAFACATGVSPAINPATAAAVRINLRVDSSLASDYLYRRAVDGTEAIELIGRSPQAVMWAVDGFCRDVLKVSWPVANDGITRVGPVQNTLAINQLGKADSADFPVRGWRIGDNSQGIFHFNYQICNWMARSQQSTLGTQIDQLPGGTDPRTERGFTMDTVTHSFFTMVPPSLYATHPEYFPLINGQRINPDPNGTNPSSIYYQICLSNSNVKALVLNYVKNTFASHPELTVAGVCQNDGNGGWCQCAECVAMDGDQAGTGKYSNRMIAFVNSIAAGIAQEYPGKKIGTLAYAETVYPPTISADANVQVTFCTSRNYMKSLTDSTDATNSLVMSQLNGWRAKSAHIKLWEYFYFTELERCAAPWSRTLCDDYKALLALGIEGFTCETYPKYWSGLSLFAYTFSRLTWDTSLTYDQIIASFCAERYGPAAAKMEAYHRLYEDKIYANVPFMGMMAPGGQLIPGLFTQTDFNTMSGYLDDALTLANSNGTIYHQAQVGQERALFDSFKQLLVDPATLAGIGTNLVSNSGAESLGSDWSTDIQSGSYSFNTPSGGAHSGSRSFNIQCTGTAGWARWYRDISGLTVGKKYSMRVWVKATSGMNGEFWIYQGGLQSLSMAYTATQNAGWVMLVVPEFTATATSCTLYLNAFGDGTAYFDDIFLAEKPGSPPVITSSSDAIFYIGQTNEFTISATGSPPVTLTASGLPDWAVFNSATGKLSGTPPNAEGSPFTIMLTASNGITPAASQFISLSVRETVTSWKSSSPVIGSANSGGTPFFTLTYRQYAAASGGSVNLEASADLYEWQPVIPDITLNLGSDPVTGDPIIQAWFKTDQSNKEFYRLVLTLP